MTFNAVFLQVSWEPDGSFIGSDAEFEVGVKSIHRILAARNISMR